MDSSKTQRLANPNWRPSAVTARAMVGTRQPYIGAVQRKAIREGIQLCRAALVPDGQRVVAVWWDARERVATAINARTEALPQ